jgi:hypothetical protein
MTAKEIKEVSEDTLLGVSVKTLIMISAGLSVAIAGYYDLKADVAEAKKLPEPSITRVEYELKDEMVRNAIMETQKQVEQIDATVKKIDERLFEMTKK